MRNKRLIALILAGILAFPIAGCGNTSGETKSPQKETNAPVSDTDSTAITFPLSDTQEFSVFTILNAENDLADSLVMKTIQEDSNVKFTFESVMVPDLVEKRNLVLASGEYPDIFLKSDINISNQDKYGQQGLFTPLEDLIREYAPNLTAVLDEMDGWDYITAGDGHIYSLPQIVRQEGALTTYWINKRWMDNLNLSEPTNLDELYEVLKAFKEEDANGNGDPNDEIPITGSDAVKPDLLLPYFGIGYDYGTKLAVIDNELTYIPTSEIFKEYIAFVTRLYQEGIMDKNIFTQKHEQQGAIGQAGDVLGSFFDAGAFLTVGRDNDDDYIALTPFEDGLYPLATGIVPGTLIITDKCENPETVVALFDQFYSEEGGIMAWMGIEGETWQLDDEGNWEWILENGYGDDVATVRNSATIQGAASHPSIIPDFWYDKMSEKIDPDEVYLNHERAKVAAKGSVPLPMMRYSEEDSLTIATLKTDIDAYIDQYVAQVATGKLELEGSWEEYVTTINNMGGDQLISIYQKAYEDVVSD